MIARLNSSLDRSSFSLALSELMESALPFLWLSLLLFKPQYGLLLGGQFHRANRNAGL